MPRKRPTKRPTKEAPVTDAGYTCAPEAIGRSGCDVCGRKGIEGKWGVTYTSTMDKTKLHVCIECYGCRNAPYMQEMWKKAVDKAFPNLVKHYAQKKANDKENDNGKDQKDGKACKTGEDDKVKAGKEA